MAFFVIYERQIYLFSEMEYYSSLTIYWINLVNGLNAQTPATSAGRVFVR